MPYIGPPSWGFEQVPTSADFNTYIRDNMNALFAPPRARFRITTAQTPAPNTLASIAWTNVVQDPYTMRNPSNFRQIIIPAGWPGTYEVMASAIWHQDGSGRREMSMRFNNFQFDFDIVPAPNAFLLTTQRVSTGYPLFPGDVIEIGVSNAGQGSPPTNVNVDFAELYVAWRGAS